MEKIWLKQYDPGVPPAIKYPNSPLYTFLDRSAAGHADSVALVYQGNEMPYGFLLELVDRFAGALNSLGLAKGDRLAIQLPTCPQFIIAYYAALKLGAIAVPLNPAYVFRETAYYLNNSGAKILITSAGRRELIAQLKDQVKLDILIISNLESYGRLSTRLLGRFRDGLREKPATENPAVHQLEELIAAGKPHTPVDLEPTDPAVILFSGDTSGAPMGALLTHANLTANVLQCLCWNLSLNREGRETILLALPLSHSYGMTIGMNLGLATASRLVLIPRFEPGYILDVVEKTRVTYFPGVPSMFEALLKSPDLRKHNLRSIRTCLSGGAPLPMDVQQNFEQITGSRLIEGYGLTEASPVTHSNPYWSARHEGSIGLPLPDTEMKIISLHDPARELPPGEVGELCVRGPQIMKEYYTAPKETARVLRDGWLVTGDIARIDEDGYTYILDRKKNLIISGGYNVYPAEVQSVLLSHPLVEKAAVSGLRDPYKGEALQAEVILKAGADIGEGELFQFCRENLAAFKIPRRITVRHNANR